MMPEKKLDNFTLFLFIFSDFIKIVQFLNEIYTHCKEKISLLYKI